MAGKTRTSSHESTAAQQLTFDTSGIESNKGNASPVPGTNWYSGKTVICPQCSAPVPDRLLACPVCTEAASNRTLREYQMGPLRIIARGHGRLRVRSIAGVRHLQMFGAERTYCGVDLSSGHRRNWMQYFPEELAKVCAICRGRVEKLIEEALA